MTVLPAEYIQYGMYYTCTVEFLGQCGQVERTRLAIYDNVDKWRELG